MLAGIMGQARPSRDVNSQPRLFQSNHVQFLRVKRVNASATGVTRRTAEDE
jgi:hypothetical protein